MVKLFNGEICFHHGTATPEDNMRNWFEVDKLGLAQILERKGKEFALFELVQNAWDEPGVTKVSVALELTLVLPR